MIRFFMIALCGVLIACGPRAELVMVNAGSDVAVQPIFVQTNRELAAETGLFTSNRVFKHPGYFQYDITMPPNRAPGQVPYPKGKPDPNSHMLVNAVTPYANSAAFETAIATARRSRPGEALLYVHGYNNTYADGVLRVAQMVEDYGFTGVATHFSWPSAGRPLGYVYDRDSMLASRTALEDMIASVTKSGKVVIMAHSVGSALTMEALRQIAIGNRRDLLSRISGVILISPDIDVDVFREQATRIGDGLSQPFVVFTSARDRALRVSAGITGLTTRLGSLEDTSVLDGLPVQFVDLSELQAGGDALGHFAVASSPLAIRAIQSLGDLDKAFSLDRSQQTGLLPGGVLQIRKASRLILRPIGID
jgi:esterase/lipase superfamily enzyme